MKKNLILALMLIVFLTGCADTVSINTGIEPVGFWYGLWHGLIVFPAWVCSLFSDNVSIYAVYNNGGWYDFGFMLGIGAIFGGSHN